jgi:hypothetical protein
MGGTDARAVISLQPLILSSVASTLADLQTDKSRCKKAGQGSVVVGRNPNCSLELFFL